MTVEPGETQAATRAKAPRGALSSRAKGERKLLATPTPVVLEDPDNDQREIRKARLGRAIDGVARWPESGQPKIRYWDALTGMGRQRSSFEYPFDPGNTVDDDYVVPAPSPPRRRRGH